MILAARECPFPAGDVTPSVHERAPRVRIIAQCDPERPSIHVHGAAAADARELEVAGGPGRAAQQKHGNKLAHFSIEQNVRDKY
jgi:hypothetical protein